LENIEIILTNCIQEIRTGKATLKECLERYPSLRSELEPLLKMALNIQEPPALQLDPGYKQSAKAQLLRQIRSTKQKKPRTWKDIISFGLPPQLVWARVMVTILISVIVISMLGGSTAYASQGSLPGEMLYPVKVSTEEIRIWMAGKNVDKAELNLEFAQNRLKELSKLAARNSNKTGLAVEGYKNNLQSADSYIQSILDASTLAGVLEKHSEKIGGQISFCDSLFDTNYSDNPSLQDAASLAVKEQINLLTELAQQNNLQAAQLNLNMMHNRLQRAQTKANERQYQAMCKAMLQYQQFNELGQQILEDAHYTQSQAANVENISAVMLQSCLETINTMSQQVPQEYQNIIESSRHITIQFQNRAHYGYRDQRGANGGAGQGHNTTTSNDDSGDNTQQCPTATFQPQGNTNNTGSNNSLNTSTSTPGMGKNDRGGGPGTGNTDPELDGRQSGQDTPNISEPRPNSTTNGQSVIEGSSQKVR
jgi:hypothetical protein